MLRESFCKDNLWQWIMKLVCLQVLGCEKGTSSRLYLVTWLSVKVLFRLFSPIKILSIYPSDLISWSAPLPLPCPDQQGLQSKYFARTTLFPPLGHYPPRSRTPAGPARIISRCHHDRYLGSGNAPFVRQGLPITPVIIFNFATFTAGK